LSVELVSAIFTGLTGLLAAVAAVLANRSRRIGEDSRTIRRQARTLQRKFLAALSHIFTLETELAARGLAVPPRPEALEQDADDDDGPTPSAPRGSHASA
jgi:hypothetical protein